VARTALRVALVVALGACAYYGGGHVFERFVSDAATRLAYQIRDEAAALRRLGQSSRTFEHVPETWPEGLAWLAI
jgi:hypothetical protein